MPRVSAGGYSMRDSIREGILTRARDGWCRMRPIKGRQIGNVGLKPRAGGIR